MCCCTILPLALNLHSINDVLAADAAELPARRRAGLSFRASVVPSQPVTGGPNLNRSSASSVERSADSPRDMHSGWALDLHRFSMPAQRRASSRSRYAASIRNHSPGCAAPFCQCQDMHVHYVRALGLHRFSMPAQRRASSRSRCALLVMHP